MDTESSIIVNKGVPATKAPRGLLPPSYFPVARTILALNAMTGAPRRKAGGVKLPRPTVPILCPPYQLFPKETQHFPT